MIYGILIIFFFYCFGFLATYKSKRKKNAIVHSDLNYSCIWFIHIKRFDICYIYTFPSLTSAHLFVSPHPNSPHPNSPHPNSPHPNSPHPNSPHPNFLTPTLLTPTLLTPSHFVSHPQSIFSWVCVSRCTSVCQVAFFTVFFWVFFTTTSALIAPHWIFYCTIYAIYADFHLV